MPQFGQKARRWLMPPLPVARCGQACRCSGRRTRSGSWSPWSRRRRSSGRAWPSCRSRRRRSGRRSWPTAAVSLWVTRCCSCVHANMMPGAQNAELEAAKRGLEADLSAMAKTKCAAAAAQSLRPLDPSAMAKTAVPHAGQHIGSALERLAQPGRSSARSADRAARCCCAGTGWSARRTPRPTPRSAARPACTRPPGSTRPCR